MHNTVEILANTPDEVEAGARYNVILAVIKDIERVAVAHVLEDDEIIGVKHADIGTEAAIAADEGCELRSYSLADTIGRAA